MTAYALPRDAYELLVEALGEKADIFARAMERSIQAIEKRADETIVEKKGHIKIELKDEFRQELVTRELFEERMKVINERFNMVDEKFKSLGKEMNERFNVVDERFKSLDFKLNIFIAIALIALTLANPTFVALLGRLFALP